MRLGMYHGTIGLGVLVLGLALLVVGVLLSSSREKAAPTATPVSDLVVSK